MVDSTAQPKPERVDTRAMEIAARIAQLYPGEDPCQILAGPVAKAVMGPLPPFSERDDYLITGCTAAAAGAFTVAYGNDPSQRDEVSGRMGAPRIVLIERLQKRGDGGRKYGALGGFVNLDNVEKDGVRDGSRGEYPEEGAVREMKEELLDPEKRPILDPDPARLKLSVSGIDYRRTFGIPCSYTGFSLELAQEEMLAVQSHVERLHTDQAYAEGVYEASNHEVVNVVLMSPTQAAALQPEQFFHPHEYVAVRRIAEDLCLRGVESGQGRGGKGMSHV